MNCKCRTFGYKNLKVGYKRIYVIKKNRRIYRRVALRSDVDFIRKNIVEERS